MSGAGRSPKLAASLAQNRPLDGSAGLGPDAAQWWRGACVYQVYVRSFCDSNGDGQGDFAGLLSKLDYIASLGVDAIWLSPIHSSPNRDWGYDVSDFEGVHPDYGTLTDFQTLSDAAHARGLKIVLDEVLCHTSDEHAWFAASRDGDADKRDWYVWGDPKDDGTPPNNWLSVFGGEAWSYQPARRQYYHHKFLRQQPKLNWQNAAAREAALKVLDLWLTRGVDGFRLDVANAFLHDPKLTDNPAILPAQRGWTEWLAAANMQRHWFDSNLEDNKAVLNVIRQKVEKTPGRFVFGEFSEEFERSGCYLPSDRGLHAGYNFALLMASGPDEIAAHLKTLAAHPDHWPGIAFSNHDVIRTVTRFGGDASGDPALARLMLAVLFALRGTVLLYQGEELGLPEVDLARDQLRDPVGDLYYPLFKGRDGCRTPMPWDAAAPNLGFTTGTPWLPLGPTHGALSVSVQEHDAASPLNFARAMAKARKTHAALRAGALTLLDAPEGLLAFVREGEGERILCLFNLSDLPQSFEYAGATQTLPFGIGDAKRDGAKLALGPRAAFFALIQGG